MSRSRLVAYWVTTGWAALGMASGGVAHVLHVQTEPGEQNALAEGGYVVRAGMPDPLRARLQRRSH